jgi:formamidopyrimidine-DNA glycosylase
VPELPEVETIRVSLAPHLDGRQFGGVEVWDPVAVRYPDAETFAAALPGRRIVRLGRRGKYLLVALAPAGRLILHLRMSGRLYWRDRPCTPERHSRLRLHLDDGSCLDFIDMRRLGGVYLPDAQGRGEPQGLSGLGPEPLSRRFTPAHLGREARRRRTTVKAFLLDQRVVAGLGNIYVDEALFRARLHPTRPVSGLTDAELERLARAIRAVLRDGLTMRGVSFSLYRDGLGRRGQMTDHLRVYGRAGAPCVACGGPVHRTRVAGRGTSFCPACQAPPTPDADADAAPGMGTSRGGGIGRDVHRARLSGRGGRA